MEVWKKKELYLLFERAKHYHPIIKDFPSEQIQELLSKFENHLSEYYENREQIAGEIYFVRMVHGKGFQIKTGNI